MVCVLLRTVAAARGTAAIEGGASVPARGLRGTANHSLHPGLSTTGQTAAVLLNGFAKRAQRDFFRLRGGAIQAPLQKRTICFAPSDIIVVAWRFPSAVARLRAEPNTALAPLSHMLKNGFLFSQGFFIRDLRSGLMTRLVATGSALGIRFGR